MCSVESRAGLKYVTRPHEEAAPLSSVLGCEVGAWAVVVDNTSKQVYEIRSMHFALQFWP